MIARYTEDLIEKTNITLENLSQFTKHSFYTVNIEKTNYMILVAMVKLYIIVIAFSYKMFLLVRFFNVDISDFILMYI